MSGSATCRQCGASLGAATQGLCPRCLVELGIALNVPACQPPPLQSGPAVEASLPSGQAPADSCGCTAKGTVGPMPLAAASRSFGDYELLEEIGHGGMGVVYRARQRSLDRLVAIKMMAFGPGSSPELVKRFRAEAVSAASLHHPHIVAIYEVGIHEGHHFFVMGYVEGQSLARLVGNRPLPARRAAGYLKTVAEAVHYAHERGILHRDLKPSNVLIDAENQPHVVDFGLARRLEGDSELTVTGQVLGSPHYLPPEQAAGQRARVSRRTDVYALGATLYHLLTGRPPFQAESLTQTLDLVLHAEPIAPRLLNPSVPRDLETICLKCLEKEPSRRYPTAQELADELARFQAGEPINARPLGAAGTLWRACRRNPRLATAVGAAVLSLVIGLAGVAWQWRRAEAERQRAAAGEMTARRNAYAADLKETQRALQESDLGRARELLSRHRPAGKSRIRNPKSEMDLRSWEWRYLWACCQSDERFTLCHYSNSVSALAFSADGMWLALRREDGAVVLWDAVTKRLRAELPAPAQGWVSCNRALAFSPREHLLAWGRQDASGRPIVSLRDVDGQKEIASFAHPAAIRSITFSPDVRAMATLSDDGTLRVWDIDSHQEVTNFPAASVDFNRELFSATAQAAGTSTGGVAKGPRGLESPPFQPHSASAAVWSVHYGCVLFSPDGRWLAVGETGARIRFLDWKTGLEKDSLAVPPPGDGVTAMAFSPDGRLLAAGCGVWDNDIHVWDLVAGTEVRLTGHSGWIAGLAFSPDGQTLASASADQTIRLWDVARKKAPRRFRGDTDEIWALAWSPDGRDLVTGAKDGLVRYWDPAAKPIAPYEVAPEPIYYWGLAFLPDSKAFLTVTRSEGAIVRWDAATVQAVERLSFLGTNHTSLDLSPDGRWLALGDAAGNIRVWDFPARQVVTNLPLPGCRIDVVFFSSRGNLLAGVAFPTNGPPQAKLWAVGGWREISLEGIRLEGGLDGFISADERTFAAGYLDGTAAWWDLATRQRRAFFDCHYASGVWVAFSPDGRLFATGGMVDGLLTVWDTVTRQPRPFGRASRNGLQHLIFSPDSQRLVASGMGPQDVVKLWDVETGRDVATLSGEGGWICHLGFSPDGNTLFGASSEGRALLWRAPSFAAIDELEAQRAGAR